MRAASIAAFLLACAPTPTQPVAGATGEGTDVGPQTGLGSTWSWSGSADGSNSTGGDTSVTTGSESSSRGWFDPTAFLREPDGGSSSLECDIWVQNCPPGEKCMPWASDGGGAWNATRCSPIAADPGQADEPCTVEGSGVSGVDDCDFRLMCWDVGSATGLGSCVPMCLGSENAPFCADPDRLCSINAEGVLVLCLETCHPLAQSCPSGQGCYPVIHDFICAPDAGGDTGAYADPCEYLNVCDPGLACVGVEFVADCNPAAAGCCTPFCPLDGPESCPGAGEECVPWFDGPDVPPGYENVGVCMVPQS